MKLFAGKPAECSMLALRPQETPGRQGSIVWSPALRHCSALSTAMRPIVHHGIYRSSPNQVSLCEKPEHNEGFWCEEESGSRYLDRRRRRRASRELGPCPRDNSCVGCRGTDMANAALNNQSINQSIQSFIQSSYLWVCGWTAWLYT